MTKFQLKLKELENKNIDSDIIIELVKDYNQKVDNLFLVEEFLKNYNINQYYTRNLYEIIESLIEKNNFYDVNNFCDFLEKQLNSVDTLSSLNRDIFIKIYLKLTKNTQNIKKLYDEYISKKYINVSTIEDFTEYFLNNDEETLYFIKSFLYDKEWWFRLHYYYYKSWIKKEAQDKILKFSKENLTLFFDELNKKENIRNLLHELYEDKENNFIKNLINKAINLNLENKLYDFLISQIKFAWNFNDYYSKNAFFNRNIKLFNLLKNKLILNYQQFFKDIYYWEPWYYYYSEFEHFIFQTIETKKNLDEIAKIKELEEKDYFIRNGYFYIKYTINDPEKSKLFEEVFPEQVKAFDEQRQKSIEEGKKYKEENDKEILDEIKENLEKAKDTEKKLFVPKFLEDFINKFDYQLRIENETVIHKLVKNQLEYFFTWENLDISTPDTLSKFQKTNTWYNAPSFMHDGTFWVIFKSAKKVWFNLSKYKNKLAWYYPFQWNAENAGELKKYFWIEEIKQIIDIYKNYPDIREYQSYNIIYLFQDKYKKEWIIFNKFLEEIKQDINLKNDLVFLLKELNKNENFNKYYLKESLVLLYELGVEKSYFQSLELTQPPKSYFKDILQPEVRDDEFKKYLTINEFLIKTWDKDAFLWRLEQLLNWFIDIPNYKFENGEMRRISDLEDEIDSHYFIKILWEYKYIDEYIEKKVIELIEKSFKEYDNFENYCKYIWKAMEYYLRKFNNIDKNFTLTNWISNIIANENDINKIITFYKVLNNLDRNFITNIELRVEKIKISRYSNYNSIIKEKDERIKKQWKQIDDYEKNVKWKDKEINQLKSKINFNIEFSRYTKKNILLVEWPTDKKIIEYVLFNVLNRNIEEINYFIQNIGGTNEFDKMIKIFSNSEQYDKVICLYDFDWALYNQWNNDKTDKIIEGNIYNWLLKVDKSWKIFKLLLPLTKNAKLEKQVIKKWNNLEKNSELKIDVVGSLEHYWENTILDLELMFYWIDEKIDNMFFLESDIFPHKPIVSKYYRSSNSDKVKFLSELLKSNDELNISKEKLFWNIIKIISIIDKILW